MWFRFGVSPRHCLTIATIAVPLSIGDAQAVTDTTTRFVRSRDGTRIAYDVNGSGPFVMLLHGGGQTRHVWHDAGYVTRLASEFTVITLDQRGHGTSDKPTDASAYAIDRLIADMLSVADAAGASSFALWGFSYGANTGRYLAARSDRVESMVYIGIPFGPAVGATFRRAIDEMRQKWLPLIEADRNGRLDLTALTAADRTAWLSGPMPVTIAWLTAMLDYPPIEPRDLRVRTLWVVGTANAGAMESVGVYRDQLRNTPVTLSLFEGLNHPQELVRIDTVFPQELEFTRSNRRQPR